MSDPSAIVERLRADLVYAVASAKLELRDSNYLREEMPEAATFLESTLALLHGCTQALDRDLRGQISIAHSRVRRMPLKRDDALQIWASFKEIQDKLEDLDAAAALAGFADPSSAVGFHPQILLPRTAVLPEVEALTSKLGELDSSIQRLATAKSDSSVYAIQNDLIDFTVERASSNSAIARALSSESSIDVHGVHRSVDGIGSTAEALQETVNHPSAVTSDEFRAASPEFVSAATAVTRSGQTLSNRARTIQREILGAGQSQSKDPTIDDLVGAVSRMDLSSKISSAVLLEHDGSASEFVSELACQLIIRGFGVVVPNLRFVGVMKEFGQELSSKLVASRRLLDIDWTHAALTDFLKRRSAGFDRFMVVIATASYVEDVLGHTDITGQFVRYSKGRLLVYLHEEVDIFKYGTLRRLFGVSEEKLLHGERFGSEAAADQIVDAIDRLRSSGR